MTPEEREILIRLIDAFNATNVALTATLARVTKLEENVDTCYRAIHSMHSRLQMQECGTVMYEVHNVERTLN